MAISERDIKLLWGRAAGRCSHPECDADLTTLLESGAGYTVGEMAHVIGRRPGAPRATPSGGPDTYENLILLCPTHHTHIDKAPEGTFPESLVQSWKRMHEERVRSKGRDERFRTFDEMARVVCQVLGENKVLFDAFGPRNPVANEDPSSNLHDVWSRRRLDRILPNNRRILNILEANSHLLPPEATGQIEKFKVHALAYETHAYNPLDRYPHFPIDFPGIFSRHE